MIGRPLRHTVSAGIIVLALAAVVGCGSSTSTTLSGNANTLLAAGLRAQVAGNLSEALADYNQVLSIDPKNKYAFYNLGLIAQQQHRDSDADKNYRSALLVDPEYQPAIYNLATLVANTDPLQAIDLYRHLIRLAPKNASAHNNLGYALKSVGQNKEGDYEISVGLALKNGQPTPTPLPS